MDGSSMIDSLFPCYFACLSWELANFRDSVGSDPHCSGS